MKITRYDFEAYLKVQKSGVTNMFAVDVVSELTGLTREKKVDIMTNYAKYKEQYE